MRQTVLYADAGYAVLDSWFADERVHRILLVCDGFASNLNVYTALLHNRAGVPVVCFSDFQPNPLYENVLAGLRVFRDSGCDAIAALGGGSAIDVAKCIKLYSGMSGDGADGAYLTQPAVPDPIPFLAIPTTAGTGSESTRFAVIYYCGIKQSVADERCIPETVLMDAAVLQTLPQYQKKATMLDAFCHAVESYWSVNSTQESRALSDRSIRQILAHMDGYLHNTVAGNAGMLLAANTAGRAIDITQTTAGHAMCYKITSMFGCAHGHAAALCDRILYPWMIDNAHACVDPRGETFLRDVLDRIAQAMGCGCAAEGAAKFVRIFDALQLPIPAATQAQFAVLKGSVNPVRLKNHPISLQTDTIDMLYHKILGEKYEG